ncbi:hypothetical protein PoHVEF18_010720 [Penicillium ochrochloron]
MELEEVSERGPHPASLDGLVFFARKSSGPHHSSPRLKNCVEYMHKNWTKRFGGFDGPSIHIFGIQCARKSLVLKHLSAFMEFVEALEPQNSDHHPRVELVVSAETGFLTNIHHFCQFFERVKADWRYLVFDNTRGDFTRIDVYGIIEHFNKRPTTLDDETMSFILAIKKANDARQTVSENAPKLGPRERNRSTAYDRPDLNGRDRNRARARRVQVRECSMCPRQFLTDEQFYAHASIHGPQTLAPLLRNIDHDPEKKPLRWALHTFESTLIRAWRCLGCGLETSSSGTFENHPSKCRKNPEKKTGLGLFTTWVTDADEMKRPGFECRICFSSISKEHIARAHVRQEHERDADGHYLRHQDGFKVVCPEPGCGFTFQKLFSLAVHCHRWHGWQPETALKNVEYRFLPGLPNDPLLGAPTVASEDACLANITPTVQPKTDLEDPVFEGMLAVEIPETPDVLTRPRPRPLLLAPPAPHTLTAI